ncbi:DsbA family oxidoreductase [Fictibacillus aquaticus]|uniref:Disulfide bond formation protein DsbA n=1 Tax=Fictibacillus aquaticus TaxID=2021314 RepID=A0A235F7H0_9BACL|nr:DsbA family oxidoreductase [Fictibacillus aquaticus]OYD57260.1 disulfide bond formation protein DsbA [Fictibacillus aquaticus]
MKVEIWSDIACPFCYIGKRKFETALEDFGQSADIEIEFKSFELDPNAKKGTNMSNYEMLAAKYGMSIEQAKVTSNNVAQQARAVGLEFDFDKNILTNTKDAHRLLHLAKEKGKMIELKERILKAYFTEGLDVGDHEVLAGLAEDAGLSKEEASRVLTDGSYSAAVEHDENEARELGITGVPFFVFNRKYAVSGAQNPEHFLDVLNQVYEEEKGKPALKMMNSKAKTEYCSGDNCGEEE